jgi:hypothetical protein
MVSTDPIELHKPILGELAPGIVSLGSVPIIGDALQVGVFVPSDHPKVGLSLIVGEHLMRLSREDGQPLQVADNDKADGSGLRPSPVSLFTRPVPELLLRNTVVTEDTYRIEGAALEIPDRQRFDKFLTQVFLYAYRRQHPDVRPPELLSLLDAYGEF